MPYAHVSGEKHRHLDPHGSNHVVHDHPGGEEEHEDHEGMFPPEGGPPEQEREPLQVITAFLVFQTPEGIWAAHPDITQPLLIQRAPHTGDFTAGCAVVQRDVQAMEMIQRNMAHAAQMAEQMRAMKQAEALGIGVPGGNGPMRRMGAEKPL